MAGSSTLMRQSERQNCRTFDDWISPDILQHMQAGNGLGYPTQKPLALLERIIEASSNEGDMVLDPFCRLRHGVRCGGEAEPSVGRYRPVLQSRRTRQHETASVHGRPVPFQAGDGSHRHPKTDGHRCPHTLPAEQACAVWTPGGAVQWVAERISRSGSSKIDHVVPRSRGGTDHLDNLQLLCGHCNRNQGR